MLPAPCFYHLLPLACGGEATPLGRHQLRRATLVTRLYLVPATCRLFPRPLPIRLLAPLRGNTSQQHPPQSFCIHHFAFTIRNSAAVATHPTNAPAIPQQVAVQLKCRVSTKICAKSLANGAKRHSASDSTFQSDFSPTTAPAPNTERRKNAGKLRV